MGALGVVERSTGYLQGGYKDATIHSKIQLFNTTNQTGAIVYDTGYQRYYQAGISVNYAGYFSISTAAAYNKFNYITVSASASFTTTRQPNVSACNWGIMTKAWVLCTTDATITSIGDSIEEWVAIDLSTDTPTSLGSLSTDPEGTTRQGLSTGLASFFVNTATTQLTAFNHTTQTVATSDATFGEFDTTIQIPCGMSVSDSKGYIVGMSPRNVKVTVSGSTVMSVALATAYTYNFGESHSVTSSTNGFMMAGYIDTTGRYGSQHALCQTISLATEAITTLPDLVLAQSSGQMMQGF